jgi:hypothetical protein
LLLPRHLTPCAIHGLLRGLHLAPCAAHGYLRAQHYPPRALPGYLRTRRLAFAPAVNCSTLDTWLSALCLDCSSLCALIPALTTDISALNAYELRTVGRSLRLRHLALAASLRLLLAPRLCAPRFSRIAPISALLRLLLCANISALHFCRPVLLTDRSALITLSSAPLTDYSALDT